MSEMLRQCVLYALVVATQQFCPVNIEELDLNSLREESGITDLIKTISEKETPEEMAPKILEIVNDCMKEKGVSIDTPLHMQPVSEPKKDVPLVVSMAACHDALIAQLPVDANVTDWQLVAKDDYSNKGIPQFFKVLDDILENAQITPKGLQIAYRRNEEQPIKLGRENYKFNRIRLKWKQQFAEDFTFPTALKLCRISNEHSKQLVTVELWDKGKTILLQLYDGKNNIDIDEWKPVDVDLSQPTEFEFVAVDGQVVFLVNGKKIAEASGLPKNAEFHTFWVGGNYSNSGKPDPVNPAITWIQNLAIWQ